MDQHTVKEVCFAFVSNISKTINIHNSSFIYFYPKFIDLCQYFLFYPTPKLTNSSVRRAIIFLTLHLFHIIFFDNEVVDDEVSSFGSVFAHVESEHSSHRFLFLQGHLV